MKKKDYLTGVYKDGKFMPYSMYGEYRARLDPDSNPDAIKAAKRGEEVHGSFIDGNFRPAEGKKREGYISKLTLHSGQVLMYDFKGNLSDKSGRIIGRLDRDGRLKYAEQESGRDSQRDYSREGNLPENRQPHIRIEVHGVAYDVDSPSGLNQLANYIVKSNRVLGKLGAGKRRHDILKGINLRVYEGRIPEFDEKTKLFAGYNSVTQDRKNSIIVIDSRLKPYEKIATLAHEMAHVAELHSPRNNAERAEMEREAQTNAIKQLTTLYEDYEALQKSTRNAGERAFFNVSGISKREIGKAITFLVGMRRYFRVNEKDLEEHTLTFRRVAHDLEGMVAGFIGLFGIVIGLFFLSTNLTGKVIGNISDSTSNWTGIILLSIGLVGAFFWFKKRGKLQKSKKKRLR